MTADTEPQKIAVIERRVEDQIAGYRCRRCGRLSHEPSGNCEHGSAQPLFALADPPTRSIWCPVCKTHHDGEIGEQTDAGLITRACPRVPTDDPRYFGSSLYTGDRGR